MRLIDADGLNDTIEVIGWYHVSLKGVLVHGANSALDTPLYKADDIYNAINAAPTIDAEPVVRCGECARRYTELCALYAGQMNGKNYFIQQGDDFFCKKGQRLNDKFDGAKTITIPKWEGMEVDNG